MYVRDSICLIPLVTLFVTLTYNPTVTPNRYPLT